MWIWTRSSPRLSSRTIPRCAAVRSRSAIRQPGAALPRATKRGCLGFAPPCPRSLRCADPDRTHKSSGSETTFDRDLTEPAEIEAGVLRMADDVWTWCEKVQAFGRTVIHLNLMRSLSGSLLLPTTAGQEAAGGPLGSHLVNRRTSELVWPEARNRPVVSNTCALVPF